MEEKAGVSLPRAWNPDSSLHWALVGKQEPGDWAEPVLAEEAASTSCPGEGRCHSDELGGSQTPLSGYCLAVCN